MKYLDFEKHIKNEFEGAQESVQMDALLSSLNLGTATQKSPNRRFGLWIFFAVFFLASSIIGWNSFNANDNNNEQSLLLTQQPQLTSQNTANSEKSFSQNSTVNTSQLNILSSENPTITSSPESPSTSENTENNTSSPNQEDLNEDLILSQPKQTKKEIQNSTTKNSTTPIVDSSPIVESESNYSLTTSEVSNSNFSVPTHQQSGKALASLSQNSLNSIPKNTARLVRDMESVSELQHTASSPLDNDVDSELFSRMRINCPSFDNAGWHVALIPEVGVFLPRKTLANKFSEPSPAFDNRIASESTLEGLEIGLYGMLVRDNVPFYIKGGVSYSRISERMNLEYEYTERDTTVGIISTTVSSNGDTITHIYGDIVTETTYKGSNRQHHYVHLFDFPISVGYTTYVGGFDIGVEAGVRVNFMTRATGNLLTSQSEYTNLSLNRLFKNRIGVNYFGGLMIGRNFGQFGDIYIAPRFTYFPNDFTNDANPVSQKYFAIGLNAGIVYKIN